MRDEPNAYAKGPKDSYLLIPLEGCYWLMTAGRWSWKLTSAKECVTTHLPKQVTLKMDGTKALSRCIAVNGTVDLRTMFVRPISPNALTSRVACR